MKSKEKSTKKMEEEVQAKAPQIVHGKFEPPKSLINTKPKHTIHDGHNHGHSHIGHQHKHTEAPHNSVKQSVK